VGYAAMNKKNGGSSDRAIGSAASEKMSGSQADKIPTKGKAPTQDRWFDTQLGRMYADLAAEPLPKEMMVLLEKLKNAKS
jgi:hypothetical protein